MNFTKKIFISLLSIFTLAIFSYGVAFAQTASSSAGIVVATVNIYNAKIVTQNDRDFTISFGISNKVGVQPEVKYAVQLTQTLAKKETQVDEKVYDETLSLGENTTVSKTINYTIPSSLSAGAYNIWISSQNGNGLPLGVAFAGEVKITDSATNTVQIIPGSCYISISTSTTAAQIPIGQGIALNPSDILVAKCKVVSTLATDTVFTPSLITRSPTSFGDIVPTALGSAENIIIKNGTNNISIVLPKVSKPQSYNLTFSLVSPDAQTTSNAISFNYLISGQSGTIQNVVFDKTFYKAGDTANLKIFSTQTGTNTKITALVVDSSGTSCSSETSKDVSNFSIIDLEIPITKDCMNPKATVSLSSNGNILDSKDFQVMTPANAIPASASTSEIVIILLVIVFVLIISFSIYRKRYSGIK